MLSRTADNCRLAPQGESISANDNESFVEALRPFSVQTHTTDWHVVLLQCLSVRSHSVQEACFRTLEATKSHAHPQVERPQPYCIDLVAYGTQDGVQISDPLFRLDLDDNGGLFVEILPNGAGGVENSVPDPWYPTGWRGRASSFSSGPKFGGRHHMLRLFHRFNLGYDDGCSSIESVPNRSVVMTRDSIEFVNTTQNMVTKGMDRT